MFRSNDVDGAFDRANRFPAETIARARGRPSLTVSASRVFPRTPYADYWCTIGPRHLGGNRPCWRATGTLTPWYLHPA